MTINALSTCATLARCLRSMAILVLMCAVGHVQALDVVNITATTGAANEQGSVPGRFTVTRSGSTDNLTVPFTVSGSAVEGISNDYTSTEFTGVGGSISFVQGEISKTITITPRDDTVIEGKEIVAITLTPETPFPVTYILGINSTAQIDIADNDIVARVVVVDSQADEDTALAGFVNDVDVQRRGIVRVQWTPPAPSYAAPVSSGLTRTVSVRFGGSATLSTDYVVQHKIMGTAELVGGLSRIGYEASLSTTGLGYNVYAYLVGETVINVSAGSAAIPPNSTITFAGDSTPYILSPAPNSSGLSPGTITLSGSGLQKNLANGAAITVTSGMSPPTGFTVNNPYPAGSTSVKIGDGSGSIFRGDAVQFVGDSSMYVATSDLAAGVLSFVRYSGSGTGAGLNLAIASVVEAKTLITTTVANGVAQFLVPRISDRAEFSITPVADAVPEGQETVTLTLIADKDYANSSPTVGTVNIADANVITSISLGSNAGKPNTSGYFMINFANGPFPVAINVPYTIDSSSTAIAGTDYTALSGSVTIPAGQSSGVIQVNPLNTAANGLKNLTVSLSQSNDYKLGGSGGDTSNSSATLNITDSIGDVAVTAFSSSAIESPTTPISSNFTITLNRSSAGSVNVNYLVSGSAAPGTRYQTLSGFVTIPGGLTTATVQVTPIDNLVADGTQSVVLTLAPGQGYTINSTGPSNALINILDDEPTVSVVRLGDASKPSTTGSFRIGYPGVPVGTALNREVEVFFTYSGTAVSGTDYTTSSAASIKIPANSLATTIIISPKPTPTDSSNKTLTLTITANTGYTTGTSNDTMSIFAEVDTSSSKPKPGSVNSGSSSGGCGMGSGFAALAGLGLFALFAFRRRSI
jgi:Calx-beta domain